MKRLPALAASIVFAGALAACDRESTTATAPPASPPGNTPAPAATTSQPEVQGPSADYNQALERLHKAAQGLRDSIQALAQKQPGPQRTVAIAMAHNALNATNQAMAQLPPEMRRDPAPATGSTGPVGSQPDDPQAVEALQKAAEQLRKSVQAMADEPAGERRDAAVKAAHQALYDTNQAMIQLPTKAADKK